MPIRNFSNTFILTFGLGLVFSAMLIIAFVGLYGMSKMDKSISVIHNENSVKLKHANNANDSMNDITWAMRLLPYTYGTNSMVLLEKHIDDSRFKYNAALEALGNLEKSIEGKATISAIKMLIGGAVQTNNQVIELAKLGKQKEAIALQIDLADRQTTKIKDGLESFIHYEENVNRKMYEDAKEAYSTDKAIIAVMTITILLFFTISLLLYKVRTMWMHQKVLSHKDHLTNIMNKMAFTELVEYEILRHQRDELPFSIAYLDIDDFKSVNDKFGHRKGDELLKAVVVNLVQSVRVTDVVARIGGDEFAIFLPATGQDAAKTVLENVMKMLHDLTESQNFMSTFSMGVSTCTHGDFKLDEILSTADKLMYEVKKSGKNNIHYAMYPKVV